MSTENYVTPECLRNLDLLQSTTLRIHIASSSVAIRSRLDDPNFKSVFHFFNKKYALKFGPSGHYPIVTNVLTVWIVNCSKSKFEW